MAGLVPDGILQRRDKIGFATPEAAWLSSGGARVRQVMESPEARAMPVFKPSGLSASSRDAAGFPCWRVLNFIRWCSLTGAAFS